MVDSADEPPLPQSSNSWAKSKYTPSFISKRAGLDHHPDSDEKSRHPSTNNAEYNAATAVESAAHIKEGDHQNTEQQNPSVVDKKGNGAQSSTIEDQPSPKAPIFNRFIRDVKRIIRASWINWLLIFVPVGIGLGVAVDWAHSEAISPSVVFAVNAVAIIPLASLLSFATESVASKLGDTIGALLNVTFGNAVEIIIFIIALVAKEVRVVQAAAVGSILSNLLLILGMCFVAGGLRFREQLYNSAVSQMSACLLCLSVISLLLPTAFHASFSNTERADYVVLKVSRGTSVVLLFVYLLYLLFQLKSHAFMYASTPQHLIDEESHPGVLAEILNSSSSSDSSSSSSSDSDTSSGSHTTAKRIKRALRRKRRKSISSTKESTTNQSITRTPTDSTNQSTVVGHGPAPSASSSVRSAARESDHIFSGDEADLDGEGRYGRRRPTTNTVHSIDFGNGTVGTVGEGVKEGKHKQKKSKRSKAKEKRFDQDAKDDKSETKPVAIVSDPPRGRSHVGFAPEVVEIPDELAQKRSFNIRQISDVTRPVFNSSMFPHHQATGRSLAIPMSAIRPVSDQRSTSRGLHRTSSLPDIRSPSSHNPRPILATTSLNGQGNGEPEQVVEIVEAQIQEPEQLLSRTSAIVLLLCSTGLVALCAEFLVGSIDYLIATSGVSQAFIGLIILPIVGNAAEHVTAVTVAAKNKMDLAINIALGSSIQIALFVTPFMVILGWIIKSDMSLYFSLFETVSLFASAFIVSFLMIDGRSNYLEGALLIAAYVIIAVAAFFYPSCDLSEAGGAERMAAVC